MYLHVLVSAVVVGWLSGVALAASGEGLRTEFGGTYANNTPTVGQTLRSDGTGYVPQDMTGITECPLAWDATTNQFECRVVDDDQLTEVYCRQNGTNCPSGLDVDTTLFVTPTGSGTVCSISEPCGSVQQCIKTAYTEGPPSSTNRYACQVAPGVYTTSTPIRFSSDGTERGKPVNWLKIDGGDWKYTSLKSSNLNEPVMIIERVHNVKLDGINLAYSLVDNTVPVLELRDGWKGIQLWHSAATQSTDQPTPVVHVNGAGGTLWTKEFETFNLEVDESAPHYRIEATVRATSVPGQCDVANDNGACLVDADCNGVNDQCLRNTGDFYIDHGVIQSGSAGVHFLYGNYCEGGSTTLTGTADPDGTATLTGSGTNFDPEAKPGHLITVNNESRMVISVESDTSLTVSRAFSDTASGAAITQTDDGSRCEADSDCDSGTGTCQEGVCSGDSSVACTTANEATDCSGAGGTCNVGGSFSNIFVNQRYQMGGNEGGICPEDLNYCNADTDCNTCTTDSDCQTNFSDGECSAGRCTCEMFSFLVEGNASEVSLADVTFDCLYQSGSCSPAKYQIALLDGSDAEVCGLKTDSKSSNYLSSGSQILSNCYDYSYAEQFSPLSADPPVAIQEEGLCWWSDTENQLKCYDGTNDVEVVMVDESGCVSGEPVVYDGSGNPSCAAVSLISGSAGITGTLAVGNGGTGGTSFTTNGVLYGQNLGALAVSNAGTDNQYLASNGGVPTFQALDADDIGAGAVALTRGGMGEAIGGEAPGGNKDCMFFYDGDQVAGEEMRFDCEATTQTNDYAWVFTGAEWGKLQASNNGDVLHKSSGDLVFSELTADSLNADFGDFTCTGAATGCALDADSVSASAIQQIIGGDNELVCVGAASDWCIQHDTTRGADTGEVQDDTYFVAKLFAENDWQLQDLANADINQGYRNNNNQTEDGKISTSISPSANLTDSSLMEHIEVDYSLATLPMHAARRVAVAQTSSGFVNRNLVVYAAGTGTDSNATGVLVVDYLCTATLQGTTVGEYFVEKGAFAFQRNANGTFSGTPTQLYVDSHTSTASGYSFNVNGSTGFGFAVLQAQDTTSGGAGTVSWVCTLEEIFNAG